GSGRGRSSANGSDCSRPPFALALSGCAKASRNASSGVLPAAGVTKLRLPPLKKGSRLRRKPVGGTHDLEAEEPPRKTNERLSFGKYAGNRTQPVRGGIL